MISIISNVHSNNVSNFNDQCAFYISRWNAHCHLSDLWCLMIKICLSNTHSLYLQVNVNLTQKLRREDTTEKQRGRRRKEDDKENTEPGNVIQSMFYFISLPLGGLSHFPAISLNFWHLWSFKMTHCNCIKVVTMYYKLTYVLNIFSIYYIYTMCHTRLWLIDLWPPLEYGNIAN